MGERRAVGPELSNVHELRKASSTKGKGSEQPPGTGGLLDRSPAWATSDPTSHV